MAETFFKQVNTEVLEALIGGTSSCLCYAAPGIQLAPAMALIGLAERIGSELILVFLDVDENVFRMGYGDIQAIQLLKESGIEIQHISGLRNGLIVSDDEGYSYTPTALFLEKEGACGEVLNSMRLMPDQVKEALARLSPASKSIALAQAKTAEEREKINNLVSEKLPGPVEQSVLEKINDNLASNPPANFDVARQVRVFQPYFQYVELSLTGAAVQRQKLNIPKSIQNIGVGKELDGRLKTTFALIANNSSVSSKIIDNELRDIREKLTRSLGKKHGRIIRKATLPKLEERLAELRKKIEIHQNSMKVELEKVLTSSKKLVMDYYLPLVVKNPPDELYGIFGDPTKKDIKSWLVSELEKVFPYAEDIIGKIQLDVNYKDVTYDTLNQPGFLESIQQAYPGVDWVSAYAEFLAVGESK